MAQAKKKNGSWWSRLWTRSASPRRPARAVRPTTRLRKITLPSQDVDALVYVGRDLAGSLERHPERYLQIWDGRMVLMVDDAAYEALFYLYNGCTQHRSTRPPSILFMGMYPILSPSVVKELMS